MDLLSDSKMKTRILDFLGRIIPFKWLSAFLPSKFILYGHVISDSEHLVKRIYNYPGFKEFDHLVSLLKNAGYTFVDFDTYLKDDKRKKVLLTIDDGFKVVKDEMHEKLKARVIPYMVFITTKPLTEPGYIFPSLKKDYANNEPMGPLFLNEDEINFLKKDGVTIGFHTKSHQLIKEEADLLTSPEIIIEKNFVDLFSTPMIFSYPYFAPSNYRATNQIIQDKTGAKYFFDTKGLIGPDTNHFFRVCIDSPLDLNTGNNTVFMVKRQILQSLYHSKGRNKAC